MSTDRLLRDAAAALRQQWIEDELCDERLAVALAALLEKAAKAWPLDVDGRPQDPAERSVLYEALAVAQAVLRIAPGVRRE